MAEISVLRQHIINYAKTRDTYVAYRKAGYSKKFMAEHEADLLLHKAAKQAFEELGYGKDKKLPTIKTLQAEYAKLLEEKKKAYGEYRKDREGMKELLTVKTNVDRILRMEVEQEHESKKRTGSAAG